MRDLATLEPNIGRRSPPPDVDDLDKDGREAFAAAAHGLPSELSPPPPGLSSCMAAKRFLVMTAPPPRGCCEEGIGAPQGDAIMLTSESSSAMLLREEDDVATPNANGAQGTDMRGAGSAWCVCF